MKTTITKRLQAIIIVSITLITHSTDLNGRENEGFLARPIAWASSVIEHFRPTRKKVRTEIPKERLAFQAAQVNGAVSPHITQEERAILIKNLGYFKQLVANAKDVEAARTIMISIILPEQRGQAQRPLEGVKLYTEKFTEDADKSFFNSTTGRQALQQFLMYAPTPQQNVSRVHHINQYDQIMQLLQGQLNQKQTQLLACKKKIKLAEKNPKVIAALKAIAQDPNIEAKQKRLVELKELLEKQSRNPDLEKVIPLVQAKDEELTDKMTIIMQNSQLSQGQKQKEAQAILAEYELFLGNFPPAKEFFELQKESVILQDELQQLIQKNTKKYPELAQYAKLMQLLVKTAEEYQKLIGAAQGVPTLVQKQVAEYNAKLWCVHLDQWFNACIKALESNAQPDDHILSREHEMKAQTAEWHAVIEGHKDLAAYKAAKMRAHLVGTKSYAKQKSISLLEAFDELQNDSCFDSFMEYQYKKATITQKEFELEAINYMAKLHNIPANPVQALKILGIKGIPLEQFSVKDKEYITQNYLKQSAALLQQNDPSTLQKRQLELDEAYAQVNNLLAIKEYALPQDISTMNADTAAAFSDKEAREKFLAEYKAYLSYVKNMDSQHTITTYFSKQEVKEIEDTLNYAELLERKVNSNTVFNKMFPHERDKAENQALKYARNFVRITQAIYKHSKESNFKENLLNAEYKQVSVKERH